jgi:HEAT repeat protein
MGIGQSLLDVKQEVQGQDQQIQDVAKAVLEILHRQNAEGREVRAGDSLSIRDDAERQRVKRLVAQFRALSEEQRQKLPATLNAVGKLEFMAGDFEAAQQDFQQVAKLVAEGPACAEAHHNAYRAALERRNWNEALRELIGAVKLDAKRFIPFPMGKYQPIRILGAGGFGIAFLCRHKVMDAQVVVKTLSADGLERDLDKVFAEAKILRQLDHPGTVRLQDAGFTDAAGRGRPYLVMDYFPGKTLEEYVKSQGPLTVPELLAVARPMAEALQAAHGRGILHRDVKPSNLLVHKEAGANGQSAWQVKVIDFGLALRQAGAAGAPGSSSRSTLLGHSITGTLDYAAPEQVGRLPGVAVSPASDVYSFAKTCCYALFATTQPLPKHWRSIPDGLARLLEECLDEAPAKRPSDFGKLLPRLQSLAAGEAVDILEEVQEVQLLGPRDVVPVVPINPRPLDVVAVEDDEELPRPTIMGLSRGAFLGVALGVGGVLIALGVVLVVVLSGRKSTPTEPTTPVAENTAPPNVAPPVVVPPAPPVQNAPPPPPVQNDPPPPPAPAAREFGPEETVTLNITGVTDLATRKTIEAKLVGWTDQPGNHQLRATPDGTTLRVSLAPVRDAQALAKKIDFGQVTGVKDRAIDVTIKPATAAGPPPARTKEEAIAQATADLKSGDAKRQRAGANRLARLRSTKANEKVTIALEGLLGNADAPVRQAAAQALATWGTRDSVPPLLKLLEDKDKEVRAAALLALGKLHDERAVEPVAARLADDTAAAGAALKEMGPMAEKAVLAHFRGPVASLRLEACKVLDVIATSRDAGEALRAATRDKRDPQLAQAAALVLQHDAAILKAVQDTRDSFPGKRGEGLQLLAHLEPNARRSAVARILEEMAAQNDAFNHENVLKALAVWGTPETVPVLLRLVDQQVSIPKNAPLFATLAKLKDERAVDVIAPSLTNFFEGEAARKALKELGEVGEWQLHKYLNDPNPPMRKEVCAVLQAIGTADSLPALRAATQDTDADVAKAAQDAIRAIESRQ